MCTFYGSAQTAFYNKEEHNAVLTQNACPKESFGVSRHALQLTSAGSSAAEGQSSSDKCKGTSWSRDVTPPLRDVKKNTFG